MGCSARSGRKHGWQPAEHARGGHCGWEAAFIDRELYLPRSGTNDPARCRTARVGEQVGFQTKPQLARVLLERAKGRRLYDWTRIPLDAPAVPGCTGSLLAPRPRAGLQACSGPAETTLLGLVRVAGTRWTVEESFQAKTEVGLDHHQLRRWRLLVARVWTTPIQPGLALAWSGRRHRRAQRAHYSRRERQHWLQS